MTLLSIVIPCYNEEATVELYYEAMSKVLPTLNMDHELIFVNDGSKDATLEKLLKLYHDHPEEIRIVDFSRNFGKESALLAGLRETKGDYVSVMDADLQDPPEYLSKMINLIEEKNLDVVGTRRVSRAGEPPIRSFFARQFYKIINKMIEVEIVDGARDYRVMKRQVVNSILSLNEYSRFSKGLFVWVGYNCEYLEYENIERVAGETKWSFWKLFRYAIDGIIEFTNTPLELIALFGSFLTGIMTVELIVLLIMSLIGKAIATSTLLISLILFIGGVLLLSVGLIALYLGKTYGEVKGRPHYIVRHTYDGSKEDE